MTRVFVVEDEAVVAMELKDRLRTLGFEVCGHAARGDKALRDIPAAQPDLVFMDVNLGRGISGLEVAEQLRQTMDVPIIFLSAYSATELMAKLPNAGVVAFLPKPLDWNRILPAINELLARVG